MKRTRIFAVLAVIVIFTLSLSLYACSDEEENPRNIPVSHSYGISFERDTHLVRYDYNEFGDILGVTHLSFDTLLPLRLSKTTYRDRAYEYDREGRIVGYSVEGTPLEVTFDDKGFPASAKGYVQGYECKAEFACNAEGKITEETFFYTPYTYKYEYDELGRPICVTRCNKGVPDPSDYQVIYGYHPDFVKATAGNYIYRLNLNESGLPIALTIDDKYMPWAKWSYDESGRCVEFEDTRGGLVYKDKTTKSTICYDDAGRLSSVSASAEYDNSFTKTYYKYEHTYEYGEDGNPIRTTEKMIDRTNDKYHTTVCDLEDGKIAHTFTEYFELYGSDEGKLYQTSEVFCFTDKNDVRTHITLVYDTDGVGRKKAEYTSYRVPLGRRIADVDIQYNEKGEFRAKTVNSYELDEEKDIYRTGVYKINDEYYYGATTMEIKEYVGDVLRRKTIELETTDDEDLVEQRAVYEYNEKGIDTKRTVISYRNGELYAETESLCNENGWTETSEYIYHEAYNIKNEGKAVRTEYHSTYYRGSSDLYRTVHLFEYKNDILVYESISDNDDERENVYGEEGTAIERSVREERKFYTDSGELERTEKIEYEYHDTYYKSKESVKVYDTSGKLVRDYVNTFAEDGRPIGTTENPV